uniref:Conotoxin n=1 Tax=Conus praecellens TaxID=128530 RepID=A0A291C2G5_CONPC|nr:conotoxin [Conus praecellens]
MMSKLGVLLTICLLMFPLTVLPLDGDQPADQLAERMQVDNSAAQHPRFDSVRGCCKAACSRYMCWPCCT